ATVFVHKSSIRLTINKKKVSLDVEIFREILQIYPKIPGQKFKDLPLEHDILSFIRYLRHSEDIIYLTNVSVDYLHQPWRAFPTIINKCLNGKETRMDKIYMSRAQILWGMFYKKNINYVYLLWEDLLFQIENKEGKKTNKMSYPRFTKIIIDYFMSKDQSISRRNKMFWHIACDDTMYTAMRYISRHKDTQVYGTILPNDLTNQAMLESKAYKTYYDFASREKTLKPKYVRKKADSNTSPKQKPVKATKGTRLKTKAKVAKSDKKKQPVKTPKAKGLDVLSKVALTEVEQLKLDTKRSTTQFHSSHVSDSGDGVDTQSEVPDVQQQKSKEESWTFSQKDEDAEEESDKNDDNEETKSDNDGDDLTHPNLLTYEAEDQEEEKADEDEVSPNKRVSTPPDYELFDKEENKECDDKIKEGEQEEEEEEEEDDLYIDVNINLERSDAKMTDVFQENVQANQVTKDTHMILTTGPLASHTLVDVPVFVAAETPSSDTTIPQPPIPNTQPLQQTPDSITTTIHPTMTFLDISNFLSLFQFDQRYFASKMKEAVDVVVQLQTNKLREEANAKNQEFRNEVDSTMKAIIKEQVQAQVLKIMLHIENPTYDLIKGTCKSLVELEYHLEEVFKAANDQLDWHNPEGKPYLHDLIKHLSLILNEQGRQVIPLDHFINNDLEYLKGESSSKKYATFVTKMKAADYGQVRWIKDKKFYEYASNMESKHDVYSRHRIITVTSLKIMKWFDCSHLEEIIVQRQDDQLYKFREGDFKRLRRQDIKDMLLLLVQNKLTNLNLKDR
nr:hypothetical protein [Tanacetum cinerariifolium]